MKRINMILNDSEYLDYFNKIQAAETDRIYCRHDMNHFLDVSRIAYIISLEEKLNIDKEIIYAMGLLHDIGRWMEYENGVDHAVASKALAAGILQKCNFTEPEIGEILIAIEAHRNPECTTISGRILYQADKLSRNCLFCKAKLSCKKYFGEAFLAY